MQYLQGSKKRDGGSNRILNGESAKETMLSEIRVRPPFIISSCSVYISWLFRMSAKCVRNLGPASAEQSAVYLQSAKKNIVTVFHSVKAARLSGF